MNIGSLFSMWARLGVNFPAFEPSQDEPLIEELIAQTSLIGRYEPRLIEGMAAWLQKHGDLVNTSLMHKHIANGDPAVIGLLFDLLSSKETAKINNLQNIAARKRNAFLCCRNVSYDESPGCCERN